MPVQVYKAKVSEHQMLAGTFQYIALELIEPNQLEFQAGQYIMLTVPGMPQKRSYSIASSPILAHKVELVIDTKPQGPGSKYLASLKPGDEVEFLAPAGQFVIDETQKDKELIIDFIATGSGITPIRSIILDLLQTKKDTREIHLHWGMRFVEDIFWEEDFHQLAESYPNFTFDLVLSQAPENWPLCVGHVGDCLASHHQSFANTGFYLCGNTRMVKEVGEMLAKNGVNSLHIHHEKFY